MPSTETSACGGALGILRGYEEEEEEEEEDRQTVGISFDEGGLSPGNLARFVPFAITALISQSVPYKVLNFYHKSINECEFAVSSIILEPVQTASSQISSCRRN